MSLPTKVQAQIDAAKAHFDKSAPIVNTDELKPEHQDIPAPQPEPEPAPEPAEPEAKPEHQENWQARAERAEQQLAVLKGKYNAEVPRLNDQIKHLGAQLEAVSQQATQQHQAPSGDINEALGVIREELGDEFVGALDRLLNNRIGSLAEQVNQVNSQVGEVSQQVQQSGTQALMDTLSRTLAAKGIDFERLNADPGFNTWLDEIDPYLGATRRDALNQAFFANRDIARAALIFERYHQENQAPAKPESEPNPLQQHVQVAKPPAAPDNPAQSAVWDQARINKLYRDRAEGRISEQQFQQQEAELFAALKQPQ